MIVYAINIHMGGGKVLLDSLLTTQPFEPITAVFIDSRYSPPKDYRGQIFRIDSSFFSRLRAELKLKKFLLKMEATEKILAFGNLPPIFKLKNPVVLYLQNALLLPSVPIARDSVKVFFRSLYERFHLRFFLKNCTQVWVQSDWMKETTEKDFEKKIPVFKKPLYPVLPEAENLKKEFEYILITGADKHKRLIDFLHSHKQIQIPRPKTALVVDNLMPAHKTLIEEINKENISLYVFTNQTRSQVFSLLKRSDTLIVTSKYESFCLPFFEAKHFNLNIMVIDSKFLDKNESYISLNTFQEFSQFPHKRMNL